MERIAFRDKPSAGTWRRGIGFKGIRKTITLKYNEIICDIFLKIFKMRVVWGFLNVLPGSVKDQSVPR